MFTIESVYQEFVNENASEVSKRLCYQFLREKTLFWQEDLGCGEWTLVDFSGKIYADIIHEEGTPPQYHANCSYKGNQPYPSKPFDYLNFDSFSEAIMVVSFKIIKAGFIVLPPNFEIYG